MVFISEIRFPKQLLNYSQLQVGKHIQKSLLSFEGPSQKEEVQSGVF